MRKLGAILSVFYFFSVVGYGVEFHYCLGRVTDVNLDWIGTSCACDGAHTERVMKCCDELSIQVQVDDEHQANAFSKAALKAPADVVQTILSLPNRQEQSLNATEVDMDNGPPDERIFLRHCSLVFYG